MSRAARIVANYSQGRDFSRPLEAEEILALAYDDLLEQLQSAKAETEMMRKRMQSTIEERAVEVVSPARFDLIPHPHDPTTWRLRLRGMDHEIKMLSADPKKWDSNILVAIAEQAARVMTGRIFKLLTETKANLST